MGRLTKMVLVGAAAFGVAVGSYGIAAAASGSGSSSGSASSSLSAGAAQLGLAAAPAAAPNAQSPWGPQRSDETLLTGTTAGKVEQLALAKVPGGTIVRVETDADGNAAYEAHMTKTDGTPVTVYVDKSFTVVGVESR
jgi:hypothetical protein